jgi:hypothetical protein
MVFLPMVLTRSRVRRRDPGPAAGWPVLLPSSACLQSCNHGWEGCFGAGLLRGSLAARCSRRISLRLGLAWQRSRAGHCQRCRQAGESSSPDPGDAVSPSSPENACVDPAPNPYPIRIDGCLGPTALSALPGMVSQLKGGDTLLTGLLDRSALYGVLAEIEALGLDLVELRRLTPR